MKKLILALTALMVLAGCKDASSDISFNETLFSVEGTVIKQKDLYQVMKQYDTGVMGSAVIIDNARQALIGDTEITEDMKKDAQEQLSMIKEMLGEGYLDIIKNIGYDTEEEYLEAMIYPELQYKALVKNEVLEDFDALNEEYAPRQVRILELKKDLAEAALKELKDGKDFDAVAEEHATVGSQFTGSKQVQLLKTTQVPEPVAEFLKRTDSPTLSDVLTSDESEQAYIVQVIEVDASRFENEAIDAYLSTEAIATKYEGLLFRKNNFKVYDRDILDSIMEAQPTYLKENTGE